jgi:aspartyl-tRNA(Asn)/glutamyl-tRNA(Gln) amidotransferase subunit C
MSNEIDKSNLQRIAKLAALQLDETELENYCTALSNSFKLISQITSVNTDAVSAIAHPLHNTQRLREDEVTVPNQRDELLACSPNTQAGLLLVPQVIE